MLIVIGFAVVLNSVFGGYMLSGGSLGPLYQPTEVWIICGVLGAFLAANHGKAIKSTFKTASTLKRSLKYDKAMYMEVLALQYKLLAKVCRRHAGHRARYRQSGQLLQLCFQRAAGCGADGARAAGAGRVPLSGAALVVCLVGSVRQFRHGPTTAGLRATCRRGWRQMACPLGKIEIARGFSRASGQDCPAAQADSRTAPGSRMAPGGRANSPGPC